MASVNKWIGIGNLGRDPEVRYMPSGEAACNFSIACTDTWKDKSGQKQERTEWVRITIFGKLADIAGQYLKKGSSVYLEGRLQTRKWVDKGTETERQMTEVIADRMQMLGGRQDQESARSEPQPRTNEQNSSGFEDFESDIPF
jgi:single-strand DNA-binding protein